MTDGVRKSIIDEQTGKKFELVPEKCWDKFWASVSFAYLGIALVFFLWLLFDIWLRKNTLFIKWLGYSSIESALNTPIFRSFAYAFIGGALGGIIAGYRSCIFWHSEQQAFGARFVWRYLFFPWLGATLALFVYAILGSGVAVVGGNIHVGATNKLLALAIGSLVGYGAPQVVKWLDSQVNRIFKVPSTPETPASEKKVPDLAGLAQQDAEKKLADAGLKLGEITKQHENGKKVGTIFEQNPEAGSSTPAEGSVNVTIAI
jgi:hypothetical protein